MQCSVTRSHPPLCYIPCAVCVSMLGWKHCYRYSAHCNGYIVHCNAFFAFVVWILFMHCFQYTECCKLYNIQNTIRYVVCCDNCLNYRIGQFFAFFQKISCCTLNELACECVCVSPCKKKPLPCKLIRDQGEHLFSLSVHKHNVLVCVCAVLSCRQLGEFVGHMAPKGSFDVKIDLHF